MLDAERAITAGIREATDGLKTALRLQVTSAELGSCLANTWRGEVYPKGQPSIGAAGFEHPPERLDLGVRPVREIRERARLDLASSRKRAQISLRVATSGSAYT
jgi:hypothetical protein